MTPLPGILAEIAEVAGERAALLIAAARGGTRIYLPPVPEFDHWLCRLIGREEARRVCEQLTAGVGPRRVDLPAGPRGAQAQLQAKVDALIAEGRSERDIALDTGYTERGVRMRRVRMIRLGQMPKDTRQLNLL